MFKKIAAIIIALSMMIQPAGAVAYGTEKNVWDGTVDISWYDPGEDEFFISTGAQLAGLAALVNGRVSYDCKKIIGDKNLLKSRKVTDFELTGAGGGDQKDTVYVASSEHDFMGKTVHITADIDMGGVYKKGKWSGPNWTPIGGKYPMDTRDYKKIKGGDTKTIEAFFNGVLDGGGHTVSNIYCDRYTNKGYAYSMAVGLVGYIAGEYEKDPKEIPEGFQPGVRNLAVTGYISGRRMTGGIVGRMGDLSCGAFIENCANHANVNGTDSRGLGGILGSGGFGKGCRIINCYNTGYINGTYSTSTGGIIGENDGVDIFNCYNAGTINTNGHKYGRGIGGHDGGSYTVDMCYYLEGCDDDPESEGYYKGNSKLINVNVTPMTKAQMTGANLYNRLNSFGNAFKAVSGGYPVLFFEKEGNREKTVEITIGDSRGGSVSASPAGKVPYGSVVSLDNAPEKNHILKSYSAGGKTLPYYWFTATENCNVTGEFIPLKEGSITYEKNRHFTLLGSAAEKASQLDVISVFADIREGSYPDDDNLEYTGKATYIFRYGNGALYETDTGIHTVTDDISSGLLIGAVLHTQNKQWTNEKDTDWYSKDKKEFIITNEKQLAGLAYLVNVKGYTFKGKTVKLGSDISLKNSDGTEGRRIWQPIGISAQKSFRGTFDGCGYTVSSMDSQTEGSYSGLFGYCKEGTIKNVILRGKSSAGTTAGGILAFGEGARIENCINYADVTCKTQGAGGICASAKGAAVIKSCINRGDIKASSQAGGICGVLSDKDGRIISCVNYGNISVSENTAGGIAGKTTGNISTCADYGDVSGKSSIGGIAGHTTGWNVPAIKNSCSRGSITGGEGTGALVGYGQHIEMTGCQAADTGLPLIGKYYSSVYNTVEKNKTADLKSIPYVSASEKKETYTVTYKGDYEGKDVVYKGKSADLPEGEYLFYDGTGKSWDGRKITADCIVTVKKTDKISYALLKAGKAELGKIAYKKGDKLSLPEIPAQNGCTAIWDDYITDGRNIAVNALYTKEYISAGNSIPEDGYYYLNPSVKGKITIPEGKKITVDGAGRKAYNISFEVKKGAVLTLKDTDINSSTTVLTLDGASLVLEGENYITGSATETDNKYPAVKVRGKSVIKGSGSLKIHTALNNCNMVIETKASLDISGGDISMSMNERLGSRGGVLNGKNGDLKLSGGSLKVTSESNNVYGIYVKNLTVTGGDMEVYAADADGTNRKSYGKALYAEKIVSKGGSMYVHSKIHDSTKKVYGQKAIENSSFTKNYYLVKIKMLKKNNTVKVDGKTVYKGSGKFNKTAYIWVKKGNHSISVNGKVKKVSKAASI